MKIRMTTMEIVWIVVFALIGLALGFIMSRCVDRLHFKIVEPTTEYYADVRMASDGSNNN